MRSSKGIYGIDPKRWKRMPYEDVWIDKIAIIKQKIEELHKVGYMTREHEHVATCQKDLKFCQQQLKELQ